MKNKQILILFLIGAILTIVGAFLKIARLPLASLVIIAGMTFEAASALLLIYKLSCRQDKNDGFIDS